MNRTDLLLKANGDLPIDTTGLMTVGPSDLQHQKDMFNAHPGEWKQYPFNGIGISKYLKSNDGQATLRNQARQQLQRDGYVIKSLTAFYNMVNKLTVAVNTTM
jgi:hypothetical protein